MSKDTNQKKDKNKSLLSQEVNKDIVNTSKSSNKSNNEDALEKVADTNSLSEEEKNKIYEEMEELFSKNTDTKKSYDISSAPSGINFPIKFNIALVIIVAVAITTSLIILNQRDKKVIATLTTIQETTGGAFAQEIIAQGQEAVKQLEAELDIIRQQQENFVAALAGDLESFQAKLNNDLINAQSKLRGELEAQNISETEIQRRLRIQEAQLKKQHAQQIADFKAKQEQERIAKEREFQQQILAKEAEKRNKEDELQAQAVAIQNQLSNTEKTLRSLEEEKANRSKAYNEFSLYHRNIVEIVKTGNFELAKTNIDRAKLQVQASPYSNEPEADTYIQAYNTYVSMIDAAIAAQRLISETQGAQTNLEQQTLANSSILNELNTKITSLENEKVELLKQIAEQKNATSSGALANSERYKKLEQDLKTVRADYAKARTTVSELNAKINEIQSSYSAGVNEQATNKIIENITLITNYLALKNLGTNDPETRQIILRLQQSNPAYKNIIEILVDTMDPTGKLKF